MPREIFGNAVALNSSTFHVATIVGPSLGGLMYVAGPSSVYARAMWDILSWHDGTLAVAWWFLLIVFLLLLIAGGSSAAKR